MHQRFRAITLGFAQQLAIDRDHPFEIAQPDLNCRCLRAVCMIGRIKFEQRPEFSLGLRKLMPRDQHLNVFLPRLVMIWHHRQHPGIKRFGIVEHIAQLADLREQTHGFRMIPDIEQEPADQHFRAIDLFVAVEDFGLNDWQRQAGEMGAVLRGELSAGGVARHPEQSVKHAPAHCQGRIDRHRLAQIGNGGGCTSQRDMAQPAFEEHLTEAGMVLRQPFEHGQRRVGLLCHAQRMRCGQQQIAVGRMRHKQAVRTRRRASMIATGLKRAQTAQICFG